MSKRTHRLLASTVLPLIMATAVQAQTETGGPIRLSEQQECYEPSHPSYDAITIVSTHPTIRSCIAAGGVVALMPEETQDIMGDTPPEPVMPEVMPTENVDPAQPIAPPAPEPVQPPEPSQPQEPTPEPMPTPVPVIPLPEGSDEQDEPQAGPIAPVPSEMTNGPEQATNDGLMPDEDLYFLPGAREIANPDLMREEITEENKDSKILEAILDLKVMGPLGTPLTREELTPEKIQELQVRGTLPENLEDLLSQKNQQIRTSQRVGPKEMEPFDNHTYSKQKGFFPPPKAYFGRSSQQFDP
jgi:hypothetical protein